ncbi:hypothetical protein ACFSX5_13685 [Devosia albogilva]|uniref:Curlin associated repeat-containing protein n=1 Tax=Devosia albogilva TaxID=429726 RepID=A0ABW5QN53_9HYPH
MSLRLLTPLAATAVLSLLSPAFGAANFSNLEQSGDANSGVVTQSGNVSKVGSQADPALQSGDLNVLIFTQTGDNNRIGTLGTGFEQTSSRNSATITQTGNGHSVEQVTQTGISSTVGGTALRRNILTVTQDSSAAQSVGNSIGSVLQTRTNEWRSSAANSAALSQSGGGNHMAVLVQTGYANAAALTQTGLNNVINRVEQTGSGNKVTISFNGGGNGAGVFTSSLLASAARLVQGQMLQDNDFFGASFLPANTLSFTVDGDRNGFGFWQRGTGNDVRGLIADGNDNEVGVVQDGGANEADLNVTSHRNVLLIDQSIFGASLNVDSYAKVVIGGGDENIIAAAQGGSNNSAFITVGGGQNEVDLSQASLLLGNLAEIGIAGSNNYLLAHQSGGRNQLSVDIWGNGNNRGSFAGTASSALASSGSVGPGTVLQSGVGNVVSLTIGTLGQQNNSGNKLAVAQSGSGNTVTGLVSGHNNEAVVAQTGNYNSAYFSQVGAGNVIAVMQ